MKIVGVYYNKYAEGEFPTIPIPLYDFDLFNELALDYGFRLLYYILIKPKV